MPIITVSVVERLLLRVVALVLSVLLLPLATVPVPGGDSVCSIPLTL